MAVISEVKCGRCDRRYSGFRSRCPYCGARRNKRGKHADDSENAKAKLIIGILLLVVLIAAVMVLIFANLPNNTGASPSASGAVSPSGAVTPTVSSAGVTSIIGTNSPGVSASASASPSASLSPSPGANVTITKVTITYGGTASTDVTMNKVGDTLTFKFTTTPASTNKLAIWDSSDPNIFMVLNNGKVTAMGKGVATLKVTVDGVPATCIIRVKGT